MVLSMDGNSPWWNSTGPELQQSTLSANLSFKNETPVTKSFQKQLGFHFQEQNSSSTQSTCQSYAETTSVDTKNNLSLHSGFSGLNANPEEDQSKSTVSFQDCVFPYQPIDYGQSVCFPHGGDPYSHGSMTAYAPYPGVHALIMGTTPTRVPLPYNPLQNEPIYVNAKQYKAILRRRECRAKLDAQNKILRARKPYLHESRHRHAINRARGSGGRFLNKKKIQEDSEGRNMEEEEGEGRGISNSSLQLELNNVNGTGSGSGSGLYHQVEDVNHPYNNHFHEEEEEEEEELRFSIYHQSQSDGGGIQRFVSVVP